MYKFICVISSPICFIYHFYRLSDVFSCEFFFFRIFCSLHVVAYIYTYTFTSIYVIFNKSKNFIPNLTIPCIMLCTVRFVSQISYSSYLHLLLLLLLLHFFILALEQIKHKVKHSFVLTVILCVLFLSHRAKSSSTHQSIDRKNQLSFYFLPSN